MSSDTKGPRPLSDDWVMPEPDEPVKTPGQLLIEGKLKSDGARQLGFVELETWARRNFPGLDGSH
ncbi:hypothetical protein VCB98_13215 [Gammaproteobacteria bacterium AB-CW1]|uniref:Uncharacterized protein n=1 Tax=Natronospira elongata TaxID=3110268 RepID=A0AAP6JGW3_9GAMM|nr:hypothetical protein [Gammaproteobacteria bacterium AB-CW1]